MVAVIPTAHSSGWDGIEELDGIVDLGAAAGKKRTSEARTGSEKSNSIGANITKRWDTA